MMTQMKQEDGTCKCGCEIREDGRCTCGGECTCHDDWAGPGPRPSSRILSVSFSYARPLPDLGRSDS